MYYLYTAQHKGMVYDRGTTKLEHLVKKTIRYQHDHLNYKQSLENCLILKGLKIKKQPAIKSVREDFFEKWNTILLDAENSLVQLLLSESLQVVKKLDEELDSKTKKIHPNDVRQKRIQFENQYENFRKWKKVEEKQVILEQEKFKSDKWNCTVINYRIKFPTNNRNLKNPLK